MHRKDRWPPLLENLVTMVRASLNSVLGYLVQHLSPASCKLITFGLNLRFLKYLAGAHTVHARGSGCGVIGVSEMCRECSTDSVYRP